MGDRTWYPGGMRPSVLSRLSFPQAYVRLSERAEARGVSMHREELLGGLAGRVCEVGAGNGLNFTHYPPEVIEVIAVEPDPLLRGHAERTAAVATVPIQVLDGTAERLPLEDGSCDAVVASLVLCSVPDQPVALAELRRVLRPGGELRFYEHVRSVHPAYGRLEDLVAPVWAKIAGGCHPNRSTESAIVGAGFSIVAIDRFGFSPQQPIPAVRHILGRAVRAAASP